MTTKQPTEAQLTPDFLLHQQLVCQILAELHAECEVEGMKCVAIEFEGHGLAYTIEHRGIRRTFTVTLSAYMQSVVASLLEGGNVH